MDAYTGKIISWVYDVLITVDKPPMVFYVVSISYWIYGNRHLSKLDIPLE